MGEEVDDVDGLDKVLAHPDLRDPRRLVGGVAEPAAPGEPHDPHPKDRAPPIFFIHAGEDDVGHRTPEYFRVAGKPRQIWEAKGGHTDGIEEQPREYERRVIDFLDRSL